ncbi:MAG TPA: Smr/MutS family protein [Verrucomicrobiae bacterium]|nr:Smr/MutS family protein [Verrucomicrobiae bacterium]
MSKPASTDELDLHGYPVAEAIELLVQDYNARVDNDRFGCFKVIHGYGSTGQGGVIRTKLRAFLNEHLDKLRYESGDDYGDPGWTFVYPKVRLPSQRDRMAATILSFCSEGKSEEKILREFAKLGEVQVRQVIRSLAKQGKLKIVNKGTKVLYRAASQPSA